MAFAIPTLQETLQRARDRMRAELPGTDASVWPNVNAVLAKVMAGEVWELYKFVEWVAKQRFATTADGDGLDAHARVYGLTRNPASAATGTVTIYGTALTPIAAGTIIERSDGVEFSVDVSLTIGVSGAVTAAVTAVVTGTASNTLGGAPLTLQSASLAVSSLIVTAPGIGGGADSESDESLRARVLLRLRYPPHGGAAHDYVFWALAISGISRVWVDPLAYGPGTVGVWIMADDNGTPDGLPSAIDVANVQAYADANKPVTARCLVRAPHAAPVAITIAGITSPSSTLQLAITAELRDVFRRQVQVAMPRTPFTFRVHLLWQAIARATQDSAHTVTIPASDLVIPAGYIPTLGSICYI